MDVHLFEMDFDEDSGLSSTSSSNVATNSTMKHQLQQRHRRHHHNQARNSSANEDGMEHIPEEVWILIFENLDFKSLVRASTVCRYWHRTCNDSHLWKRLCIMYQVAIEWSVKWTKNVVMDNKAIDTTGVKLDDDDEIRYSIRKIDWKDSFVNHYLTKLKKRKIVWADYDSSSVIAEKMSRAKGPDYVPCMQCEREKKQRQMLPSSDDLTAPGSSSSSSSLSSGSNSFTNNSSSKFNNRIYYHGGGHAARDILRAEKAKLNAIAIMSTRAAAAAGVSSSTQDTFFPPDPRSAYINHTFTNNCEFGRMIKDMSPRINTSAVSPASSIALTPEFSPIRSSSLLGSSPLRRDPGLPSHHHSPNGIISGLSAVTNRPSPPSSHLHNQLHDFSPLSFQERISAATLGAAVNLGTSDPNARSMSPFSRKIVYM